MQIIRMYRKHKKTPRRMPTRGTGSNSHSGHETMMFLAFFVSLDHNIFPLQKCSEPLAAYHRISVAPMEPAARTARIPWIKSAASHPKRNWRFEINFPGTRGLVAAFHRLSSLHERTRKTVLFVLRHTPYYVNTLRPQEELVW